MCIYLLEKRTGTNNKKMTRTIKNIILTFTATTILLFCIYNTGLQLNKEKQEKQLTETGSVQNLPPALAFTTIALGGFRGIIADILWLKTMQLQSQGKYFEMVQLATWISKLQPGFTGATSFLAWNMAYNISITYANPKDKWRWVENGINILKTAIKDSPEKPDLYAEVAWLYIHKIGTPYDSSNLFYKNQIITDMHSIINAWHPNWSSIASVPDHKTNLLRILQKKYKIKKESLDAFSNAKQRQGDFLKNQKLPTSSNEKFNNKDAKRLINNFFIKKELKRRFSITPEKVLRLNKTFGPLNWFSWSSQALYWLYTAPTNALYKNKEFIGFLFLALRQSLENGKILLYNPSNSQILFTGPNLEIIPKTQKFLYKAIQITDYKKTYTRRYQIFMNNAIMQLFMAGKSSIAKQYFTHLKKNYPKSVKYKITFKKFIELEIAANSNFKSYSNILINIEKILKLSAIYNAQNKIDLEKGYYNFAKILHSTYNFMNKRKLPPLQVLEKSVDSTQIKSFLLPARTVGTNNNTHAANFR